MRRAHDFEGSLEAVEQQLRYRFKDRTLLRRALTHSSFGHEQGWPDNNEPLEFLGDAVIGMLIAELIVRHRPELDEGGMTRLRALLVNTRSLAREAAELTLGRHLLLGKGEERNGGRTKPTLLADAFEAVLGAVLLDGGIRAARTLTIRIFGARIKQPSGRAARPDDPKTELQELVQSRGWPLPEYALVEATGPDHARQFVVEVLVNGDRSGRGVGSSKKRAEQQAAALALQALCSG